jgi:hypothetical protein
MSDELVRLTRQFGNEVSAGQQADHLQRELNRSGRAAAARGRDPIPLMFCWNALRLVLLGMLLHVLCGTTEYPGNFGVIRLGSKAAAFFLHFSNRFWAFRHDAERLERLDAGNY